MCGRDTRNNGGNELNGPTLNQTKWRYETGTGINGDFGTGQLNRATARPENVPIGQGIAGADGGTLRIKRFPGRGTPARYSLTGASWKPRQQPPSAIFKVVCHV